MKMNIPPPFNPYHHGCEIPAAGVVVPARFACRARGRLRESAFAKAHTRKCAPARYEGGRN